MTQHFYIENGEQYNVTGTVGFLVERKNPYRSQKMPVRTLSDSPARTNLGGKSLLTGWCGETDNVSTYARGVAQVIAVYANGRARVRTLHGKKLVEALNRLGWPELEEQIA